MYYIKVLHLIENSLFFFLDVFLLPLHHILPHTWILNVHLLLRRMHISRCIVHRTLWWMCERWMWWLVCIRSGLIHMMLVGGVLMWCIGIVLCFKTGHLLSTERRASHWCQSHGFFTFGHFSLFVHRLNRVVAVRPRHYDIRQNIWNNRNHHRT